MKTQYVLSGLLLVYLTIVSGCLTDSSTIGTSEGESTAVIDPGVSPQRMICDPFQTNSPQSRERGLYGSLYYLTDDQPRYTTVVDYINNAHQADVNVYLDRLYVPTRPWDRGFVNMAGEEFQINDTKVFEYFAISVNTEIKLGTNEQPGYYQLGLLADDGAILTILDENGQEKVLVNDDGTHPTKMGCATEPVYLDANTRIPVNIKYYQGPRYHISLIAMWRPWPDASNGGYPVNDAYCGRSGNSLYFDYTKNPVVPKIPFYELLSRNWKVLENENYKFPEQSFNPCAPVEEPLAIVGFVVSSVTRTSAIITWESNISSTSQFDLTNTATGVTISSDIDPAMVNSHTMAISGLLPNTLYVVKARSVSAGGQTTISDERAFRTPR